MDRHRDVPIQLEFPWRDEAALRAELETRSGLRLHLTVTDNTSTVMSVKHDRAGGSVKVRVHHMFLAAPSQVVHALAAWIQSPRARKSDGILSRFVRENTHHMRTWGRRPQTPVTHGCHFDLKALYDAINRENFDNAVDAAITWGRMPGARRRRSIRFGCYCPHENLIRIHPLLDQDFVPQYFVRYIVFHEMLHALLGTGDSASGRRRVHTAAFRRRERAHPDYARATAWEKRPANLKRLLRRQ